MKKSILLITLLCLALFFACSGKKEESVVLEYNESEYGIDLWSYVQTEGNFTYIPINMDGKPANNVSIILKVLDTFEKEHEDLEVKHFLIEKEICTQCTSHKTFGIWIIHKQR